MAREYHEDRMSPELHAEYARDNAAVRDGTMSLDEMYEAMTGKYGMSDEEASEVILLLEQDE